MRIFFKKLTTQTRLHSFKYHIFKRIAESNNGLTENDKLILNDYELFEKRDKIMQKVMMKRFNAVIIDSSDMSIEEVSKCIRSHTKPPT